MHSRLQRALLLYLTLLAGGCHSGFQGGVYQLSPDGSIGSLVPGVALKFIKEDLSLVRSTTSDASGHYRIEAPKGRYRVTASSPTLEDYSSAPGFFVIPSSPGYQTGNFFLREPRVTVVLAVRHADRDGSNDALTAAGQARAEELAEAAAKAGVSAVYSTDFVRTRSTAQYLADRLDLDVELYSAPIQLAATIAAEHSGDVVLIVGHSDTTTALAEALLGQNLYPGAANPLIDDFDNLFVVAMSEGSVNGSVINLQYGANSLPDTPDLSRAATTNILLLRHAEAAGIALTESGQVRATEVVHMAGKAAASALFAPSGTASEETLEPLADALGLAVTGYDPANLPALVNGIFSSHTGETVVVAGDRATLQALVVELGASPVPPIYTDEFDHLMVLIAPTQDEARLVSLQFGAHSP